MTEQFASYSELCNSKWVEHIGGRVLTGYLPINHLSLTFLQEAAKTRTGHIESVTIRLLLLQRKYQRN